MTQEPPTPQEPSEPRSRSIALAQGLKLAVLGISMALLILALAVGPGWFHDQPRERQRALVEGMLRLLLFGYAALALVAASLPILAWRLRRSWRSGIRSRFLERGFLIAFSCLLSIAGLELVSAAWRAWMHRLPALPRRFAPEPPETYRIVVLGGSSALGEPYRPWISVGQIVADRIQRALPGRKVECQILAWLGEDLEEQHQRLAAITHRPDMVIVYSGHNEFAARFEEQREAWLDLDSGSRLFQAFHRALLVSPFCGLVHEIVSKNRLDLPPLAGRHQLIDPPLASESESAEILADFQRRLEAITAYCEAIRAIPVLIIPPANESDYEPSRSTVAGSTSVAERTRLAADFAQARALETDHPRRSETILAEILARHPGFAEAHFRLGKLLERAGRIDQAAPHFLAALDNDGLPIRCPAPFRDAYREVARRHASAVLIDGRNVFAAASSAGLIGDEVIQDTHHPTLRGAIALARAVLGALRSRGLVASGLDDRLDAAAIVRTFAIDADRWATACERTSEHYRRIAGYRYDGALRRATSLRYAQAARMLRQGTPPDDVGLPGIGVASRPRKPSGEAGP